LSEGAVDPYWEKVRSIFQAAGELPPEEWAAYLDKACAGDEDVRQEVESLLASHEQATDFLEREPRQRLSFAPGDLLAGRYRIERLLGSGGMGEVYAAEDRELHESVALKIIRPEIASNPRILARFKREIQLARRVTHPNVCRIYDVAHHLSRSDAGVPEKKLSFVSMELLHGRTLAARLRDGGLLATSEALPIVGQLAAGLDAAHAASIIHRDFKSANVMLVPPGDGGPPRAVITDFGLAHEAGKTVDAARLTDTGMLIGTPDYMAPEQLEDGPLSPATDVYALGVVMFEMVTGRLPFDGTTPLSIAVSRLKQAAPSPRRWVPDLDARWEVVILRCLDRDPARRYQSAGEVAAALESSAPMPKRPRTAPVSVLPRLWRTLLITAIGAIVFAIPLVTRRLPSSTPAGVPANAAAQKQPAAPAVKPRRTVAVFGFRNLSTRPDEAWLAGAFAEMLTTELSASETLRLVPGDDVERLRSDLSLHEGESIGSPLLPRIRERLGTDVVVSGSYLALEGGPSKQLRVDVRVQDAASGELVGTVSESGTQGDLLGLVSRLGLKLRDELGASPLTAEASAGVRASFPKNAEAARLYVEGLARLRRFDLLTARSLLEQSSAEEPDYPMSHSALAEALWNLGIEDKATAEADRALVLATHLGREERLTIEARANVFHKQWEKAIEIYSSLLTFYPDDLPYGLRLGLTQVSAGKAKDALVTMDKLRALPAPLRDDPGIDLVSADAWQTLHDPRNALAAAKRAEAIGRASNMRSVVARARADQGYANRDLGNLDLSAALLQEAAKMYEEIGDRAASARCLSNLALTLWNRGDLKAAEPMLEQALAIQRQMGSRSFESRTLNNLGILRFSRGDIDGAEKAWSEALTVERESNFVTMIAVTLSNLGGVKQVKGDLDGALALYAQAMEVSRKTDDSTGELTAMVNTAEVLRLRGDLARSQTRYADAQLLARKLGRPQEEAYIIAGLGELALCRNDLMEARRQHTVALNMRRQHNEKLALAQSQVMLANVSLEEARAADAVTPLREAIASFAKESDNDDEAGAHETLARALLAQSKTAEAAQELAAARKAAKDSRTISVLSAIAATEARVLLAQGRAADAAPPAQQALTLAMKSQLAAAALDARIVVAEVESRRGNGRQANALLARVRETAEEEGLLLFVKKASKTF
jgi:serine/threonine protein kinase/tetratricopeptide (TPR) repeat protein